MEKQIEKLLEKLNANGFDACFVKTEEEAKTKALSYISDGMTVALGGSETIKKLGIPEVLKNGKYNYLDRAKEGLSAEERDKVLHDAFFADLYYTSANAVIEDGTLFCVDGNGNRVAAMIYGPKNVVCVVGKNKIVPDLASAEIRLKTVASPLNTKRLNCETYCQKTGKCISLQNDEHNIYDGCASDRRICCDYVLFSRQRVRGRIKVIVVDSDMGY
ncbi:MAG: lactate utilization protein [Clostridia bacterium]|nr:lactate utilization protein [Clostridia bacterium]